MAHGERAERNGRIFGGRGYEYGSPRLWGYPLRGPIAKWITHRRERRRAAREVRRAGAVVAGGKD